jgi:phenylpropionate dioxygenase-like ring-hydroxylating dioxygenase large terminal subunit
MAVDEARHIDDEFDATEVSLVVKTEEDAWTLPPKAYTSPEIYNAEVERIFRTHWLSVGRVEHIPNPGDYFTIDLFGYPVVVVRDRTGTINCFSRICLHRSAEIVNGKGNAKLFFCPYHEWNYELTGRLRGVPLMNRLKDFDRESCSLPTLKTEVWNGFIFVNFDLDAAPLAGQVPTFDAAWAGWGLQDLVVADEYMEFDSPYNWKVLVENFMEAYHHMGTHKDLLQAAWPGEISEVPDNNGEPMSLVFMPSADGVKAGDSAIFPVMEGLAGWEETGVIAGVIFPYNLIVAFPDGAAWYQILPDTVDHFTLRIHGLFPKDTMALETFPSDFRKWTEFMRYLHMQDHGANVEVWKGITSPFARQGRLHPLERAIWQSNDWWLKAMGLA